MSWKSNYKLPISFIIFFVLMFFLLGEQLPALPTYLLGPGLGGNAPDKLHLLDLSLGDALHRPIAYLIIGAIIWALFRIFTWPIAWAIGACLWALEQLTLTPLDQRPSVLNVAVFTLTFWGMLTLVPYFIYRYVDRKWRQKGKRNAILIAALINVLLLVFFALQIYILKNSYRGFHKNAQGQADSTLRLPQKTCPDRLVEVVGKPTIAYLKGKAFKLTPDVDNWVRTNCPGVLQRIIP